MTSQLKTATTILVLTAIMGSSHLEAGAQESLDGLRNSARQLYQSGQFEEAASAYSTVCRSEGASVLDWHGLAESYFNLNRFDLSVQALERALTLSPQSDLLRVRLVEAYMGEKRYAHADECCYSALNACRDRYALEQLKALSSVLSKRNQKISRLSMRGHGIEN